MLVRRHSQTPHGKLRDECLNVEVFFTLADARRKLHLWKTLRVSHFPTARRRLGS